MLISNNVVMAAGTRVLGAITCDLIQNKEVRRNEKNLLRP